MKPLLLTLLLATLCAATGYGQTIKSLGYNSTNGQIVANTGTNVLTFTNDVMFANGDLSFVGQVIAGTGVSFSFEDGAFTGTLYMDGGSIEFSTTTNASITRTNLSLGATWLTNTNVTNFRTAIGIGSAIGYNTGDSSNSSVGATIDLAAALWDAANDTAALKIDDNTVTFANGTISSNFRTAIGLGATNAATFKTLATDAFATFSSYVEVYGPIWIGDSGTNDVFQFETGDADKAKARTNLSLGLPALTNTSNVTMMRALAGSANTNQPFSGSVNFRDADNTNATYTMTVSNGIILNIEEY